MKILVTTKTWNFDGSVIEAGDMRSLVSGMKPVIEKLDDICRRLPSRQPGYIADLNVKYTFTFKNFKSLSFYYTDIRRGFDMFDNEVLWSDFVAKANED